MLPQVKKYRARKERAEGQQRPFHNVVGQEGANSATKPTVKAATPGQSAEENSEPQLSLA